MNRKMKFNFAIYGILFSVVMLGLLILMVGFGNQIARWGGWASSLPLIALFVLYGVGQLILTPSRGPVKSYRGQSFGRQLLQALARDR
jgi:hypothetical protein